ncbi:hypothetical protein BB561_003389 [Smittium simulii]|uniref:Uncharacterized protein n=1 Tax=Smittium simulii TaxID=133385 RepID=A0A2T9YLM8_9FUNG|nr:hypothetical protein BB561_003389 [Smittium simulii]
MSNKFARLFRQSKVASFDPEIKQAYTTTPEMKKIGDWGLKYTLPQQVRTRYIVLKEMDSFERVPVFNSAKNKVEAMKAARENFLQSSSPIPSERYSIKKAAPGTSFLLDKYVGAFDGINSQKKQETGKFKNKSISQLTDEEFKNLLVEAKSRRAEFKQSVKSGKIQPTEYNNFMNLKSEIQNISSNNNSLVQSSYHNYNPSTLEERTVEGRILYRLGESYVVGVQGTLAYLPKANCIDGYEQHHRGVKTFYITKVSYNKKNMPEIELSMFQNKKNNQGAGDRLNDSYRSAFLKSNNNYNRSNQSSFPTPNISNIL